MAGSPTSSDAVVNAEKTFESAAKTNVAQSLTDTSVNDQSKKPAETQPKAAKAETKAETKAEPKEAEAK